MELPPAPPGTENTADISHIINSVIQNTQQQLQQQQLSVSPQLSPNHQQPATVYGELSILGYNGSIPHSDRNNRRTRSKFLLCQRPHPNGIKKSKHYIVKQPQASQAIQDKDLHSISFTFSRSQAIIVEYASDLDTDMFQIGRSSESPIDFVVVDTVPNNSGGASLHNHHNQRSSHKTHHSENNFNQISELSPTSHNNNFVHSHNLNQHLQMIKAQEQHMHLNNNHLHHQNNRHSRDNVPILLDNPNQNCADFLNFRFPQLQQDPRQLGHPSSSTAQIPSSCVPNSKHHHSSPAQSTISRFACRILVDRKPPYTARIYAAGFDSSRNIFLGEKATKWEQNNSIDGLTTNGVLLMHPKHGFYCENNQLSDSNNNEKNLIGGVWREVSVDGGIYAIRESRSAAQKGIKIENESNILQDGTLIDLCGATLLWRSLEGFKSSPTKKTLEEKIDSINASRPQCPVGLNTLIISRKPVLSHHRRNEIIRDSDGSNQQPYVYLKCGHVQGLHEWGTTKFSNQRKCPICFSVGTVSKLTIGIEPSFYVDSDKLTHVFNPCGHMASEKTVKYWCSVKIPQGTHFFNSICPFCALPLATIEPSHTKLIFQDYVD